GDRVEAGGLVAVAVQQLHVGHVRVAHQVHVRGGVVDVEGGGHRREDDVIKLPDVRADHHGGVGQLRDLAEGGGATQHDDEALVDALEELDPHADLVRRPGRDTVVEHE